jgi:pimeloyl-ACP methyl ester carboxylesterase
MKRLAALAAAMTAAFAPASALAADFQPTRFTDQIVGQGPDVILIPGLASSRAVWDAETAKLKDHYRLHLIQVNGFGGAAAGPNASGPVLQPTVDELHQYLVASRLTGAPVIGHSLGGLMGLVLAEQHPDDVKRLLIVDSFPFAGVMFAGPTASVAMIEPRAGKMRDKIVAETQDAYAAGEDAQIARLVKSPDGHTLALAMAKASDHAVVAQAFYDDLTTDARPDLPKVKAKVTVIYPADASLGAPESVDPLYQGSFASLPDKQFVRIDDSRHFIMYDQPEAFDRTVKAFLAR